MVMKYCCLVNAVDVEFREFLKRTFEAWTGWCDAGLLEMRIMLIYKCKRKLERNKNLNPSQDIILL